MCIHAVNITLWASDSIQHELFSLASDIHESIYVCLLVDMVTILFIAQISSPSYTNVYIFPFRDVFKAI